METAKTLYSNILGLVTVVTMALILAGMPLFYGIDTTIDVGFTLGLIAGTGLTLGTLVAKLRGTTAPPKLVRARIKA
jgi:threonine/homoserine/homoserine lactone efflux protein